MNILITNISAFSYNVSDYTYEIRIANCTAKSVTAKHTNESILKCLSQIRDIQENGGIHKVIALVSNLVLTKKDERFNNITAYEYVKGKAIESFEGIPCFVEVRTETDENKEKELSEILDEICSNITTDDTVYIDAAGGKRTIVNVIQTLTILLRYKGIQNPLTLYADIQNNPKFITDTKEFEQIIGLADAFNLFMTTGRSILLRNCIELTDISPQYRFLIDKMCEFSDKINLGKVDDLEVTLSALKGSIEQCKINTVRSGIESVIINQFLPVIEQKFFDSSGKKGNDYIRLVKWCLENDLLQQALTIFTEKIPIDIFERGIIQYTGDVKESRKLHEANVKKNPLLPTNWETAMLYGEFMTPSQSTNDDESKIEEFKRCIKYKQMTTDKRINEIKKIITNRNYNKTNNNHNEIAVILRDFNKEGKFTSETALINSVCNNKKIIIQLLGLDIAKNTDNKESKIANKFAVIDAIKRKNIQQKGNFCFSSDIVEVLYGYLYVKSVRNTVNHASSDENLNEEQKQTLQQYGYNFNSYNFETIKKNINHALNTISKIEVKETHPSLQNKMEYITSNKCSIKLKIVGHINL